MTNLACVFPGACLAVVLAGGCATSSDPVPQASTAAPVSSSLSLAKVPYAGSELFWPGYENFMYSSTAEGNPGLDALAEVDAEKSLGGNVIRFAVDRDVWLSTVDGVSNISKYDAVIAYARSLGMAIDVYLRPYPGASPITLDQYDAFILEFVARYKPEFVEVYSEPFSACSDMWQMIQETRVDCNLPMPWWPFSAASWLARIQNIVAEIHAVSPGTKVGAQTNVGKPEHTQVCDVSTGQCSCNSERDYECIFFAQYGNASGPFDWMAIEPISETELAEQDDAIDTFWDHKLPMWTLGLDPGAAGGFAPDNDTVRSELVASAFTAAQERGFQGFMTFHLYDGGIFWGNEITGTSQDNYNGLLQRFTWKPKGSWNVLHDLLQQDLAQ